MTTPPAALPPVGFWSYTRSDDDSARGKLSQLRVLVANELQHLVGREPVRLFQDTRAIPPGMQWEGEIRDALGQSSFLVPIVTPALLQSEWCCREIAIFREREQALGRADLILPVHYIDTAHLDPAEDCPDPAVFALLAGRQWIDFRDHRLRAADSEDVARKVAEIAAALAGALRRRPRATILPYPPQPTPPAALSAATASDPAVISGTPAMPEPPRKPPLLAAGLGVAALIAVAGFVLTHGTPVPSTGPPRASTAEVPPLVAAPATTRPPPNAPTSGDAPQITSAAIGGAILSGTPAATEAIRNATSVATECDTLVLPLRSALGQSALVQGAALDLIDATRARLACEAAVVTHPDEPRFSTWVGLVLQAVNLPAEAAAAYRRAAERGHPDAQNYLGEMLSKDRGIARDETQAVLWYRRAAEQGNASGQGNLGYMLENGVGAVRDRTQAVQWYHLAAEQGDAVAQTRLASMLRDDAQAVQWFRRAAQQGYAIAQVRLGNSLRDGRGIARDETQAVLWYRRAAEQGNASGQSNLGFMLENGHGVERNLEDAVSLYQRAARQGDRAAQGHLARLKRDW